MIGLSGGCSLTLKHSGGHSVSAFSKPPVLEDSTGGLPRWMAYLLMAPFIAALAAVGLSCGAAEAPEAAPDFSWLAHSSDFVDVSAFPNVHTDLRYATTNNFLKTNVYGDFHECYLQRVAADKFRKAAVLLGKEHPGWKFLVFDCLRPRSIQEKFYAFVAGTPQQPYVANPQTGSIHNYGFAIDLSLEEASGKALDMGTGFDDFTGLAEPRREAHYLALGKLTRQQIANRLILRHIMQRAGFTQLPNEWWHYDALPKQKVRSGYKIVE